MTKVEAIKDYLINQIALGELKAGDKLPSIRQLAKQFSCNKDTVQRALLDLRYEHYVHAIAKSGYYVLETKQEKEILDLPDSEIANIAYEDFRLCLNEALIGREDYLFNYYHKEEGLPELIRAAHQLLVSGYVYSKIEQLMITAGTQQALYILSQLVFPNQKTIILLEQPTYNRMVDLVRTLNLSVMTIDRGREGIDFERLEFILANYPIKFFYLIPRLHNPLGTSYSQSDMERLVALAEDYDVYLVEDDYMSDFASHAPLHYYDTHERVIYLKSFSNTIFPALRLAIISLPLVLKESFIAYKKMMDYDTHLILQKALALYITSGMYAKNTAHLKKRYERHVATLSEQLKDYDLSHYSIRHRDLILYLENKQISQKLAQLEGVDRLESSYLIENTHPVVAISQLTALKKVLEILKKD
ncbi:PLP-dependent aminotransferase family protein [Streptococcus sp. zg-JUN1979]|uniref:aminotransferase-like domain-containing protein n=1 Tax=Streptococcus sp. zg-JUN1979 TaxID=3391450 RepID=UPI0039A689D0